jgi:hypothetical protein
LRQAAARSFLAHACKRKNNPNTQKTSQGLDNVGFMTAASATARSAGATVATEILRLLARGVDVEHRVSLLPSDGEKCHNCVATRIYPECSGSRIGRRSFPREPSIPGLPGGTRLDEFRLRWYSSGCIHLASKEEEEASAQARFYRPSVDGVLRRGCKERDPARRPAIP